MFPGFSPYSCNNRSTKMKCVRHWGLEGLLLEEEEQRRRRVRGLVKGTTYVVMGETENFRL
jgi:hypothetical protein